MKYLAYVLTAVLVSLFVAASPIGNKTRSLDKRNGPYWQLNLYANENLATSPNGEGDPHQEDVPCFIPQLVDNNEGEEGIVAGAPSYSSSDTDCATFDSEPDYAILNLQYNQASCDSPVALGDYQFCTDGDDGMTAHVIGLEYNGGTAWCPLQISSGDQTVGTAYCALQFA